MKRFLLYSILFLITSIYFLSSFSLAKTPHSPGQFTYKKAEELTPLVKRRDYGPDAFSEAVTENKPIFMLLTAPSRCYRCQVYESKEYLFHPDMVKLLNEKTIPIYVDADVRQDLTRKYLEGGWPSTTVMSPDGERIYGYSGPRPVNRMISNINRAVLYVKNSTFQSIEMQTYITGAFYLPTNTELKNIITNYTQQIQNNFDPIYGGFGRGQKFPQPLSLDYALDLFEETKNTARLEIVRTTLNGQYTKIDELETNYNLFDPIEGGFHRYGTKQDRTPPHYEKMLYDNARLLRTYFHLSEIDPTNEIAEEIISKTMNYIDKNYYDAENGGFYGNTDVNGEDHYYAKNPRPIKEKARIEKTKYTDRNAMAIITYLNLYKRTGSELYLEKSIKSLDFYTKNIITPQGIYHSINPEGEKGVRGNLNDHALLLLSFVKAYEETKNKKYLKTAESIAQQTIETLSDPRAGGFFERHSPDTEKYARGEEIDFQKPSQENAIISLALARLYTITNKNVYLDSSIKAFGTTLSQRTGWLDRGYYNAQTAKYIIAKDLLQKYATIPQTFHASLQQKQHTSRVFAFTETGKKQQSKISPSTINKKNKSLAFILDNKNLNTTPTSSFIIFVLISFLAGILSFLSPCTLPIFPAYISNIIRAKSKNMFGMTISFLGGLSLVFTVIGMSASLMGRLFLEYQEIFQRGAGILIIILGFFILFEKNISGAQVDISSPFSYLGAFLFGGSMAIAWSPCVGPILIAITTLASTSNNIFQGGFLLLSYSRGLALPMIALSRVFQKTPREHRFWKLLQGKQRDIGKLWGNSNKYFIHSTSFFSAVLCILLGFLILCGALFDFNQYIVSGSAQKWLASIEEVLLGW